MDELTRLLYKTWRLTLSDCESSIESQQSMVRSAINGKLDLLGVDSIKTLTMVSGCLEAHVESVEKKSMETRRALINVLSITLVAIVVYVAQSSLFDEAILAQLGVQCLWDVVLVLLVLVTILYLAVHFFSVAISSHVPILALGMSVSDAKQFKSCVDYLLLLCAPSNIDEPLGEESEIQGKE